MVLIFGAAIKQPSKLSALRQHFVGKFCQRSHIHMGIIIGLRTNGGFELQRAHAAPANVTKSLHRIHAVGLSAFSRQPGVDQPVAEFVWQTVGNQSRQV